MDEMSEFDYGRVVTQIEQDCFEPERGDTRHYRRGMDAVALEVANDIERVSQGACKAEKQHYRHMVDRLMRTVIMFRSTYGSEAYGT